MASFTCGACKQKIDDHLVRASRAHPDGELACPHCATRLAVRPAGRWQARGYALVAGLTVAGLFLLLANAFVLRILGGVLMLAFVAALVHSHVSLRRLQPVSGAEGGSRRTPIRWRRPG